MVEPCLNRALWDVIAVWQGALPMLSFGLLVCERAWNNRDRSVTVLTFATNHETSFCEPRRATFVDEGDLVAEIPPGRRGYGHVDASSGPVRLAVAFFPPTDR